MKGNTITKLRQVIVETFGDPEVMRMVESPMPAPGSGQVRVKLTSIGLNHADLMARAGEYRLTSGDPPFTPGIEGGGVIDAIGPDVTDRKIGQRVILGADLPRGVDGPHGGTYRTHMIIDASRTVPAPDHIPDDQLGALWLSYLTAWGCLVWKQNVQPGQVVALPAASSSVALAGAQIVKAIGGTTIGLTTSADKVDVLKSMPDAAYDHLLVTDEPRWHRKLRELTGGRGVDVFFDPVGAGEYVNNEIRSLAPGGTIWIYGLLGEPDTVDLHRLIVNGGSIRGWLLYQLIAAGDETLHRGYRAVFDLLAVGRYHQHIDKTFKLDQVRQAHHYMRQGGHIGKIVLLP